MLIASSVFRQLLGLRAARAVLRLVGHGHRGAWELEGGHCVINHSLSPPSLWNFLLGIKRPSFRVVQTPTPLPMRPSISQDDLCAARNQLIAPLTHARNRLITPLTHACNQLIAPLTHARAWPCSCDHRQCPRVRHACRPYRHTRDWSVRIVLEAVPYYYRLSTDTSC